MVTFTLLQSLIDHTFTITQFLFIRTSSKQILLFSFSFSTSSLVFLFIHLQYDFLSILLLSCCLQICSSEINVFLFSSFYFISYVEQFYILSWSKYTELLPFWISVLMSRVCTCCILSCVQQWHCVLLNTIFRGLRQNKIWWKNYRRSLVLSLANLPMCFITRWEAIYFKVFVAHLCKVGLCSDIFFRFLLLCWVIQVGGYYPNWQCKPKDVKNLSPKQTWNHWKVSSRFLENNVLLLFQAVGCLHLYVSTQQFYILTLDSCAGSKPWPN